MHLDAAARDNPAPVDPAPARDREPRAARPAGRVEVARGAHRDAVGAVDDPRRAGAARGARPAEAPPHLRRARADRPPLPPGRPRPARVRPAAPWRRPPRPEPDAPP